MAWNGSNVAADTVVVLTALESEYLAVRSLLVQPRQHRHQAGTLFELSDVPGGRIALALVGAGNQGAATLTERAITEFRPRAVLFTGIAGALHSGMALGTVVVGTKVYGYHGGIEQTDGFGARPQAWESDHGLEQLARAVSRDDRWAAVLPGDRPEVTFRPIAAGEVVLNSRDTPLAVQLRSTYADAAAIEMESAGTYKAAHLSRAACLTVRGISDQADGQKHAADEKGWQPVAARNAAAFAVALARAVLVPQPAASSPTRQSGGWQPLTTEVEVVWRADPVRSWSTGEKATLEVHIVPVGEQPRLQMRRLMALTDELSSYGRARGLFTGTEQLAPEQDDRVAVVRTTDYRRGPHGLAVHRTGQRSTWSPLPNDSMGAVLDPTDLPRQLAGSLRLLLDLDDLPEPGSVALAVGVEPVGMLTEDSVASLPRRQASGIRMIERLRVPPEDVVVLPWLRTSVDDVAEELAARLLSAFRTAR